MSGNSLLVLGCGMQGRAALDHLYHYAEPHPIVVVDTRPDLAEDVMGWTGDTPRRAVFQLIDHWDMTSGFTAMQRTVGYTMALGARMILNGELPRCGLLSPVEVPFTLLERGLGEIGMRITRQDLPWDGAGQ